jgi:hypothetical protein
MVKRFDAFDGTVIEAFYHPGGLIPTLEPVAVPPARKPLPACVARCR